MTDVIDIGDKIMINRLKINIINKEKQKNLTQKINEQIRNNKKLI